MQDIISFILGRKSGEGHVILEDGDYTFTDENHDGNIVITKEDNDGE